jgi:putative transposase
MLVRGRACERVYNACLAEALSRLERLRSGPRFEQAKAMPKGEERTKAFAALDEDYGFTPYALMSYASSLRTTVCPPDEDEPPKKAKTWVGVHVGAQEAQAEGRNAFRAVRRWSLGLSGKPHFRRRAKRKVLSAECKDLCGDIEPLVEDGRLVGISWAKEEIPLAPATDKAEAAEKARVEDLVGGGKLLYCRVVSRLVAGRWCHEAQFVLDGPAPLRHPVGREPIVSIDTGPSIFHVVHGTGSRHAEVAPSVKGASKELRRLQRRLDRQHRAGSPECFKLDGTHIAGTCHWEDRSKASLRTVAGISEAHRAMAARRSSDHGRLANQLVAISAHVRAEDHGVKAWQKGLWSKQVSRRAPGAQLARIEAAAKRAGGELTLVGSRLGLSQVCICGGRHKKTLSQRRHTCDKYGLDLDRDLFTGFLGRHVVIGGGGQSVDLDAARAELFGGAALASATWEQEGVPAPVPLARQDLGVAPERALSGQEKQRVKHRRPPGRRSLVRIRRRFEAKAKKPSDRAARPEDGVATGSEAPVANQPLPTAKAA